MSKQLLSRALKIVGFFALSFALVAPTAQAAPAKSSSKRAIVKKPHVEKAKASKKVVAARKSARFETSVKMVRAKRPSIIQALIPAIPSFGQMAGLHSAIDPLDLKSSVALVIDQDTREVLFSKNEHAVLPIASLTKLMTGVIISGARLPMDELITVTQDDVDTEKHSRSRLSVGTTLSREKCCIWR